MNKQPTDEQGTEPEQPADVAEQASAGQQSKKGPLYSDISDSKRVQMAIFSHHQPGGETRYTTSICRRYKRDDGQWVSTSYFDHPRDLEDVMTFAHEAMARINRYKGILQSGDLTPDPA